jgi:hypothetical protein
MTEIPASESWLAFWSAVLLDRFFSAERLNGRRQFKQNSFPSS